MTRMPHTVCELHARGTPFVLKLTVDPDDASGERTFSGRRLGIPVTVAFRTRDEQFQHYLEECHLLALQASLTVAAPARGQRGFLAPLEGASSERLILDFRDEDIEWLELARTEMGLTLSLTITALCTVPYTNLPFRQPNQSPAKEGPAVYGRDVRRFGPNQMQLTLDQERWLKILAAMGWGDTRLIELPPPELASAGAPWQQVLALLKSATAQYRAGNFEAATEQTRKSVEGVATELARHWQVPREPGSNFEKWTKELGGRLEAAWPQDPEAARLLTSLLTSAWGWASPSHHYGSATAQRRETKFALNLATDLIDFAAHLMVTHPQPVMP